MPTKAQAFGVAQGDNRLNSSGGNIGNTRSRGSQTINNIVLPGQTLPVPANGNMFYVIACSAAINIRPSGGAFVQYAAGKGLGINELENAFSLLEIQNTTANAIAFSIFVGFQDFIDKTLYLATSTTPNVAFPTYPTANAAAAVAINDLSGAKFTDINGNSWYGIVRQSILIANVDTGVTLLLQKAGGTGSSPAILAIYPQTSAIINVSGNYALNVGGGNINAIVSEIYQAIPAT